MVSHVTRGGLVGLLLIGGHFAVAAEDQASLSFDRDAQGITGVVWVPDDGAGAPGCIRLANGDSPWAHGRWTPAPPDRAFVALRFKAKSETATSIGIQATDHSGQVFMKRFTLPHDNAWHEYVFDTPDKNAQHWGGAKDKKWHDPLRTLAFVIDSKQHAALLDDAVIEFAPTRLPSVVARERALARAPAVPLADFRQGVDGFDGPVTLLPDGGPDGGPHGRLRHAGPKWSQTTKTFGPFSHDFLRVALPVRSRDVKTFKLRFIDASGQAFQQPVAVVPDGQWHTLAIDEFARGESWGGAKDRVWHPPARSVTLVLEQAGTLDFGAPVAQFSPKRLVPALDFDFGRPGNVFIEGETPAVDVAARADAVAYAVSDFWDRPVARGVLPLANGRGRLALVDARGYFLVRFDALENGRVVATRHAAYGLLPPFVSQNRDRAPWGAMTHFAQGMGLDVLEPLAKAGIVSIRDEHYWSQVERARGEYTFPARSDTYMAACARLGIEPLIVLSFNNPLHDGGKTPHSPEGIAAFARYGRAILDRYGPQIKTLEIWNEYNGSWCDGPAAADRPASYARLAQGVYPVLKEARPDLRVLGAATVLIPMPYLEGLARHDAFSSMDALAIHPYRDAPEGVDGEMAAVEELLRERGGGLKPVWHTETGKSDKREFAWERGLKLYEEGRRAAARYLPRQYALLLSRPSTERIYWYLACDDDTFPTMGLLRHHRDDPGGMGRLAMAPPYMAYATLIRQLGDAPAYVTREDVGESFVHLHHFRDAAGRDVRLAWATRPRVLAFAVDGPTEVVDLMGGVHVLTPVDGEIQLALSEETHYLRGPVRTPRVLDGPRDGGAPWMAAEHYVDLGEAAILTVTNPGDRPAVLHADGVAFPLPPGASRVTLPRGAPVAGGVETIRFRMERDGAAFATGTVTLGARDPLRLSPPRLLPTPTEANAPDGTAMELTLENTSARMAYTLERAVVELDGLAVDVDPVHPDGRPFTTLVPGERVALRVPGAPVPKAFVEGHYTTTLHWRKRGTLIGSGVASFNPLPRDAVVDLDLRGTGKAYGQAPDARAQVGWRADGWRVSLRTDSDGAQARFALAGAGAGAGAPSSGAGRHPPVPDGAPAWMEISLPVDGTEVFVPWDAVPGAGPDDATVSMALLVETDAGVLEWGGGLFRGRGPGTFRRVTLSTRPPSPDEAPSPAAPLSPERDERLLTHSRADYGKEQGYRGWHYGYYAGRAPRGTTIPSGPYTDGDFVELNHVQTLWGYQWGGLADDPFLSLSPAGAHPGQAGPKTPRPRWPVRRWVSPEGGRLRARGWVTGGQPKSDGVELLVIVDGVEIDRVFARTDDPERTRATFDRTFDARPGSRVDFALTAGPDASNSNFDGAGFEVAITAVAPH